MARIIKCAKCGKETEATGPRSKYCRACKEQEQRGGAKVKHIKCAICGKDAVVSVKAVQAKFCKDCAGDAYKEARKDWKRRQKKKEGKATKGDRETSYCTVCGKEFSYIFKGYYIARCPKCTGKGGKASFPQERYSRRPGNGRLDAAQRAAQELGMSYGKYKAMLALQEMRNPKKAKKMKTKKKGA